MHSCPHDGTAKEDSHCASEKNEVHPWKNVGQVSEEGTRIGQLTVKNGLDHYGRKFGLQFRGLAPTSQHCRQTHELT